MPIPHQPVYSLGDMRSKASHLLQPPGSTWPRRSFRARCDGSREALRQGAKRMCGFSTSHQRVICPLLAGQQVSGIRVDVWTVALGSLVRWAQEEKEDGTVDTEDVGERVKPIAIPYIISVAMYQIGLLAA